MYFRLLTSIRPTHARLAMNEATREVQAEARTCLIVVAGQPAEWGKDAFEFLRRDSGTIIGKENPHLVKRWPQCTQSLLIDLGEFKKI